MNWAKRLLNPKDDGSFTHPSHGCPRCGGRLIDEGDTVHCDTCNYPEPENDEDDRIVCDVCGKILDSEYPTCPVCGVALCGSEACAGRHIAEHHPEWNDEDEDEDDEDDEDDVCAVCGEVLASGHPTCPCCAAPLCGNKECYDEHMAKHYREWRGKDTDDEPSGRCDDCGRDGDCGHCPGHPGGVPVGSHDPENVPFVPFHADSEVDCCFLESDFGKASIPLVATTGWRAARQNGKTYYPAFDRTVWYRENGYWKRCSSRW